MRLLASVPGKEGGYTVFSHLFFFRVDVGEAFIFFCPLRTQPETLLETYPDPLVRGTDPSLFS